MVCQIKSIDYKDGKATVVLEGTEGDTKYTIEKIRQLEIHSCDIRKMWCNACQEIMAHDKTEVGPWVWLCCKCDNPNPIAEEKTLSDEIKEVIEMTDNKHIQYDSILKVINLKLKEFIDWCETKALTVEKGRHNYGYKGKAEKIFGGLI